MVVEECPGTPDWTGHTVLRSPKGLRSHTFEFVQKVGARTSLIEDVYKTLRLSPMSRRAAAAA